MPDAEVDSGEEQGKGKGEQRTRSKEKQKEAEKGVMMEERNAREPDEEANQLDESTGEEETHKKEGVEGNQHEREVENEEGVEWHDKEEGSEMEQIRDEVIAGGEKNHGKVHGGRGEPEEKEMGGDSRKGTKEIRSGKRTREPPAPVVGKGCR